MSTAVSLQVEGVDLDDEAVSDLVGQHFSDHLWMTEDDLVTVTVVIDEGDTAAQAIDVAREVEHRVPGARVSRVRRDLVTQSDIASRAGVSREAVRKWTKRKGINTFPTPVDVIGGETRPSKVWEWADVVVWLKETYQLTVEEDTLPSRRVVAQIDACLAKADGYLDRQWQVVHTPVPVGNLQGAPTRRRATRVTQMEPAQGYITAASEVGKISNSVVVEEVRSG